MLLVSSPFLEKHQLPSSCILFATADWDEPYWTNKQHCAKTLGSLGIEVLYVESVGLRAPKAHSPKDVRRIYRRLINGLRSFIIGPVQCLPCVYVVSPLALPVLQRFKLIKLLNIYLLRVLVSLSARRLKLDNPIIWTYHPFMLGAISRLGYSKILYHCVDDLAAVPGIDPTSFRASEKKLLERADACFVTARHLLSRCLSYNANSYYLPNVVDADHFAQAFDDSLSGPPELGSIPEPRLVYHGVLSDFKIDFSLLIECAGLRPEWSFVLIGDEREGQRDPLVQALRARPNVYLLGYKSYDLLPAYLRGMQVGLLPSLINTYTNSMFPMKFYEYIAAGLPVVSTRLGFTQSLDNGPLVAGSAREFVEAVGIQLDRGRLARQEAALIVGENTWHARTLAMLNAIEA